MLNCRSALILVAFAASYALWASAAAGSETTNPEPAALASIRGAAHSPRRVAVIPAATPRAVCEESDSENLPVFQGLVLGVTY
jgi:hypothetical protein